MSEFGFLPNQKTGSIFHYTDVAAIMSIIEAGCLRLTDYKYLNDASEYHDGIANLKSAFQGFQPTIMSKHEYLKEAVSYIRNFLEDDSDHPKTGASIFVGSFSSSCDQLSQWRSYGSYAIEFDRPQLSKSFEIDDCVYDPEKKRRHSRSKLSNCLEQVSIALSQSRFFDEQAHEAYSILIREALMFKHEAFHEENEARCVIAVGGEPRRIKYRSRGEIIIPYIEVGFELSAVRAIHIGPMQHQDLAAASMASYLESIQFPDGFGIFEDNCIKVIKSNAPYRNV